MATTLGVAAIALTVTPIFVVNAFRVLATDTFVRHEIERGGFPADRYGLTTPQRLALALTGLHSILPGATGSCCSSAPRCPTGRRRSTRASCATWATSAAGSGRRSGRSSPCS